MINFIRKYFKTIDPLQESRVCALQFTVLLFIGLFILAYYQPPQSAYILVGVLLNSIVGTFVYTMWDKIRIKLFAFVIFSIVTIVYSNLNKWGIILAPITFFLVFSFMLLSYFGPIFRITISITYVFSSISLFFTTGWYSGVNSLINFTLILVISIVIDYFFIPLRKNYINNALYSAGLIFLERIQLCKTALRIHLPIPNKKMHHLINQEMLIRNKVLALGNLSESHPKLFNRNFYQTKQRLASIATRQSIQSLMLSVNDYIQEYENNNDSLKTELIEIEELIKQWLNIIKPTFHISNGSINKKNEPIAEKQPWRKEQFFLRAEYLKEDLYYLIACYKDVENVRSG